MSFLYSIINIKRMGINMETGFDAALAIEQAGGSEELARELFSMFLKELPDYQQNIQQTLQRFNKDEPAEILWDPIHKLHGATAYLGLPGLREICHSLEMYIKQKNKIEISQQVNSLLCEIDKISQHGEQILQQSWN